MNITLQTPHFTTTKNITDFVNEKVGKLFSHQTNIIRIDVILKNGNDSIETFRWCEILVLLPGENQFIKKHRKSLKESILSAVEAMERKLRRNREKKVLIKTDKI